MYLKQNKDLTLFDKFSIAKKQGVKINFDAH